MDQSSFQDRILYTVCSVNLVNVQAKYEKDILSKDGACNIIVVDDDDDILLTIKTGLEAKGFKILALEAFEHHSRDYYDLVLTD